MKLLCLAATITCLMLVSPAFSQEIEIDLTGPQPYSEIVDSCESSSDIISCVEIGWEELLTNFAKVSLRKEVRGILADMIKRLSDVGDEFEADTSLIDHHRPTLLKWTSLSDDELSDELHIIFEKEGRGKLGHDVARSECLKDLRGADDIERCMDKIAPDYARLFVKMALGGFWGNYGTNSTKLTIIRPSLSVTPGEGV